MSYILDALRRADSERERDRSAVPGLHAQALPAGAAEGDTDARPNPWKWPIVAAFIALLGMVAWLWFDRAEPSQSPAAAAPPTPAGLGAAPANQTAYPAAAPAATATTTAPSTPTDAKPNLPAPTVAPSRPADSSGTGAVASTAPAAPTVASAAALREAAPDSARKLPAVAPRQPSTSAPKPVAKPTEPEPKLPSLAELPEDVRREIPPVTIGGSIYSKSAANRMLVINGQVFHEGDALATGLVLEQIRQKSAVLRFRTYRYEVTY